MLVIQNHVYDEHTHTLQIYWSNRDVITWLAENSDDEHLKKVKQNAEQHALLKPGYSQADFDAAFKQMTDALRPWTIDFHVAQNDGSVHGTGSHDKTGRHCMADDPNGKLDIVKTAAGWLKDASNRGIKHICWDGCMFPNSVMTTQQTWNDILATMIKVRQQHGWYEAE